jgi:hypothetical protein
MFSFKPVAIILLAVSTVFSVSVSADGVFLNKKHNRHELSNAESSQLKAEFLQKFGEKKSAAPVRSNNPWKVKKQRVQQKQRTVTWGECRDYSLKRRNRCYKEARDAYHCERMYEARYKKCDNDY